MTSEAIKEIKKAEENGAQLIINARAQEKFRLEQTVKEIEKSKRSAEQRFKAIFDDRIRAATVQAQELTDARIAQAHAEADKIAELALANEDDAVNLIIEEIKRLWQ